MKSIPALELSGITKRFNVGDVAINALRGVAFTVERGEFTAIMGPSGSGKSTLLGILGGLDNPSTGSVRIDGEEITNLSERQLTVLRNRKIGFVFQQFHLIPTLTALENVMLPIQFSLQKKKVKPAVHAAELLSTLGLSDRLNSRPRQMSGGEQQRVAIARALANQPPVLLADEPTGNLDSQNSELVLSALHQVRHTFGVTIVMVTHNAAISATLDRTIMMRDGAVESDSRKSKS